MDGVILVCFDRAALVDRVAGDVENAAHDAFADGHRDWLSGVDDLQTAFETFGAGHGDGANAAIT